MRRAIQVPQGQLRTGAAASVARAPSASGVPDRLRQFARATLTRVDQKVVPGKKKSPSVPIQSLVGIGRVIPHDAPEVNFQ